MSRWSIKPENRIWLWVTLAFVVLICAWTLLVWTAVTHQPESVELVPFPAADAGAAPPATPVPAP
jgi:hypothetical protein